MSGWSTLTQLDGNNPRRYCRCAAARRLRQRTTRIDRAIRCFQRDTREHRWVPDHFLNRRSANIPPDVATVRRNSPQSLIADHDRQDDGSQTREDRTSDRPPERRPDAGSRSSPANLAGISLALFAFICVHLPPIQTTVSLPSKTPSQLPPGQTTTHPHPRTRTCIPDETTALPSPLSPPPETPAESWRNPSPSH
jgi:hypothetical protein